MKAYSLRVLKAIGIGNLHLLQWTVTKGVNNYYTWRRAVNYAVHQAVVKYTAFTEHLRKPLQLLCFFAVANTAPKDTNTGPEDL